MTSTSSTPSIRTDQPSLRTSNVGSTPKANPNSEHRLELAPADRWLRNEGVLRPLATKLARREQTAPVQCAAAATGIVGRDSRTVARGDGRGVVNPGS